jgi:hypothetical protein
LAEEMITGEGCSSNANDADLLLHHACKLNGNTIALTGGRLLVTGASPEIRRALLLHGLVSPRAGYAASVIKARHHYATALDAEKSAGA